VIIGRTEGSPLALLNQHTDSTLTIAMGCVG
jgi:hypothetical protein